MRRAGRGWSAVVEECSVAGESAVGGVEERSIDDADRGDSGNTEGYGDAEHGEQVRVVDGAVERVDDPGWRGCDEVLFGGAGGIGFFADKAAMCQLWYSHSMTVGSNHVTAQARPVPSQCCDTSIPPPPFCMSCKS